MAMKKKKPLMMPVCKGAKYLKLQLSHLLQPKQLNPSIRSLPCTEVMKPVSDSAENCFERGRAQIGSDLGVTNSEDKATIEVLDHLIGWIQATGWSPWQRFFFLVVGTPA